MSSTLRLAAAVGAVAAVSLLALAQLGSAQTTTLNQTVPGAGNEQATKLAQASPLVVSAMTRLRDELTYVANGSLRAATTDAVFNPNTCVVHRANLTAAQKQAIVAKLQAQGLFSVTDAAAFPGGAETGVFPPVLDEGTACPHLPQPFFSAPGSTNNGHQSYPGGLPVHEAFNLVSALSFTKNYLQAYGTPGADGLPHMVPIPQLGQSLPTDLVISQDYMIAAPIWHDWAKPIVFQWNADGSEFQEFNFGGAGVTDDYGAAGDSRTGGHHIISLAETMARNLPAAFIITQACAHSAPTLGNEFKVVNWLRAAAIMAQVDPVARGYLYTDSTGALRLPPVRTTGAVDLNGAGQTNIRVEYEIHNLSDADFVFTIPAITEGQVILEQLASRYGYSPTNVTVYNTQYRNPVFSYLSAERILILYTNNGLPAVQAELDKLRNRGVI
jgi:hypothetical protein